MCKHHDYGNDERPCFCSLYTHRTLHLTTTTSFSALEIPMHSLLLSIVPRLIEHMVPMPPDSLTLEQIREPQPRRDLTLMQDIISVLRLADDKLTHLHCY